MEDMKMSEVFDLPVHIGEKAASHASAISDRSGTFGIINDSAAVQVSTAINNHDRIVEENAELREILSVIVHNFSDEDCSGLQYENLWWAKQLLNK